MQAVNLFILGAITMASVVASLYFFRFWKNTGDRLFFLFGLAFLMEGISRTALALFSNPKEGDPFFYLIRMLAFSLILLAFLDKNLSRK